MDVEEFIRLTVNMPGLRDVFQKKKDADYIIIRHDLVRAWGVSQFNFFVTRLHEIMKGLNVHVYLENCTPYGYRLHVINLEMNTDGSVEHNRSVKTEKN